MRLTYSKKARFNFKSNILLFTIRPLNYTLVTCTPTGRTCFFFQRDLRSFLLIIQGYCLQVLYFLAQQ